MQVNIHYLHRTDRLIPENPESKGILEKYILSSPWGKKNNNLILPLNGRLF